MRPVFSQLVEQFELHLLNHSHLWACIRFILHIQPAEDFEGLRLHQGHKVNSGDVLLHRLQGFTMSARKQTVIFVQ